MATSGVAPSPTQILSNITGTPPVVIKGTVLICNLSCQYSFNLLDNIAGEPVVTPLSGTNGGAGTLSSASLPTAANAASGAVWVTFNGSPMGTFKAESSGIVYTVSGILLMAPSYNQIIVGQRSAAEMIFVAVNGDNVLYVSVHLQQSASVNETSGAAYKYFEKLAGYLEGSSGVAGKIATSDLGDLLPDNDNYYTFENPTDQTQQWVIFQKKLVAPSSLFTGLITALGLSQSGYNGLLGTPVKSNPTGLILYFHGSNAAKVARIGDGSSVPVGGTGAGGAAAGCAVQGVPGGTVVAPSDSGAGGSGTGTGTGGDGGGPPPAQCPAGLPPPAPPLTQGQEGVQPQYRMSAGEMAGYILTVIGATFAAMFLLYHGWAFLYKYCWFCASDLQNIVTGAVGAGDGRMELYRIVFGFLAAAYAVFYVIICWIGFSQELNVWKTIFVIISYLVLVPLALLIVWWVAWCRTHLRGSASGAVTGPEPAENVTPIVSDDEDEPVPWSPETVGRIPRGTVPTAATAAAPHSSGVGVAFPTQQKISWTERVRRLLGTGRGPQTGPVTRPIDREELASQISSLISEIENIGITTSRPNDSEIGIAVPTATSASASTGTSSINREERRRNTQRRLEEGNGTGALVRRGGAKMTNRDKLTADLRDLLREVTVTDNINFDYDHVFAKLERLEARVKSYIDATELKKADGLKEKIDEIRVKMMSIKETNKINFLKNWTNIIEKLEEEYDNISTVDEERRIYAKILNYQKQFIKDVETIKNRDESKIIGEYRKELVVLSSQKDEIEKEVNKIEEILNSDSTIDKLRIGLSEIRKLSDRFTLINDRTTILTGDKKVIALDKKIRNKIAPANLVALSERITNIITRLESKIVEIENKMDCPRIIDLLNSLKVLNGRATTVKVQLEELMKVSDKIIRENDIIQSKIIKEDIDANDALAVKRVYKGLYNDSLRYVKEMPGLLDDAAQMLDELEKLKIQLARYDYTKKSVDCSAGVVAEITKYITNVERLKASLAKVINEYGKNIVTIGMISNMSDSDHELIVSKMRTDGVAIDEELQKRMNILLDRLRKTKIEYYNAINLINEGPFSEIHNQIAIKTFIKEQFGTDLMENHLKIERFANKLLKEVEIPFKMTLNTIDKLHIDTLLEETRDVKNLFNPKHASQSLMNSIDGLYDELKGYRGDVDQLVQKFLDIRGRYNNAINVRKAAGRVAMYTDQIKGYRTNLSDIEPISDATLLDIRKARSSAFVSDQDNYNEARKLIDGVIAKLLLQTRIVDDIDSSRAVIEEKMNRIPNDTPGLTDLRSLIQQVRDEILRIITTIQESNNQIRSYREQNGERFIEENDIKDNYVKEYNENIARINELTTAQLEGTTSSVMRSDFTRKKTEIEGIMLSEPILFGLIKNEYGAYATKYDHLDNIELIKVCNTYISSLKTQYNNAVVRFNIWKESVESTIELLGESELQQQLIDQARAEIQPFVDEMSNYVEENDVKREREEHILLANIYNKLVEISESNNFEEIKTFIPLWQMFRITTDASINNETKNIIEFDERLKNTNLLDNSSLKNTFINVFRGLLKTGNNENIINSIRETGLFNDDEITSMLVPSLSGPSIERRTFSDIFGNTSNV